MEHNRVYLVVNNSYLSYISDIIYHGFGLKAFEGRHIRISNNTSSKETIDILKWKIYDSIIHLKAEKVNSFHRHQ
jgi:hypothetical protein